MVSTDELETCSAQAQIENRPQPVFAEAEWTRLAFWERYCHQRRDLGNSAERRSLGLAGRGLANGGGGRRGDNDDRNEHNADRLQPRPPRVSAHGFSRPRCCTWGQVTRPLFSAPGGGQ